MKWTQRAAVSRLIAALGLLWTLLALDAHALEPRDPAIVCSRIPTVSGEAECLRIIEGRYVDWLAAAACDRIPSTEPTLACMRAIAGRRIPQRLSLLCDAETGAWATVRCFGGGQTDPGYESNGGWQVPPPRQRPLPDGYGPRPGGCNQWGCRNVGGCNQWGCWNAPSGNCSQWGCSDHGGCNQWGCWQSPNGSCNQWGCSNSGTCTQWGCPKP